ncbi:MAG: sulfite exporter TauE/SafE family protein [Acidimicrobiales bacterium]
MHIDLALVIGSAVVGFLVGLTGAGGGALMTPMLIFLFGVTPSIAISSDLVAAVLIRPVGAAVHLRRKTVNFAMVGWLAVGSVPGALLGAWLLHFMGAGKEAQTDIEVVLGTALLLGALAMVIRSYLRRGAPELLHEISVRPLPTVVIGCAGGVMVGLTSVGSGSLMIVLLLFLYPALASSQLVGTDLVQAIPLTAAAALGQLLFGHIELGLTTSIVIGSVPAAFVGSLCSSRAPDRLVRPAVTAVIALSGLKYVGMDDTGLGVAVALAVVGYCAMLLVRWKRSGGDTTAHRAAAPLVAGGALEVLGAAAPEGAGATPP